MSPSLLQLANQAIFPLGIALTSIALCLYVLAWRRVESATERFFMLYLFLTALWNLSLVGAAQDVHGLLPGLTWLRITSYGLIALGLIYWAFTRTFLYVAWQARWEWVAGLAGLVLAVSFDMNWLGLPPFVFDRSPSWLNSENVGFGLSVFAWGFLMVLAAQTALFQQFRTQSPAHKNRIQYLLISIVILAAGYGLYLSRHEPFWTAGLIVTGLGITLATYIVVAEALPDLGTGIRRFVSGVVVSFVTNSNFVLGFYWVELFLGDFLIASFGPYMERTLLMVTVTVVLLTVVYMPVWQLSRRIIDRILFGRSFDYQAVLESYGTVISDRLYLGDLTAIATDHINQALDLQNSTLFILDSLSDEHVKLRSLPTAFSNGTLTYISLQNNTPVTRRLIDERQALAQYTIDISPHFKKTPDADRQTLKQLAYEWFIPIQREGNLVGLLAVGTKNSRRPYTSHDLRLLNTLADQTALALDNAMLFDRVQRNLEEITNIKNLMNNVFDSMENGVITTDVAGRITFYNRAAETILATPLAAAVGISYAEVFPTLANTIFANLIDNVIERSDHYRDYEIISDLPQRGRVNLNLSLSSLKDVKSQTQGVTIVIDDLTETKRLQAVQDMFRRYVSPAVVDRLPSDPKDLELGGHRQEATILFADIRGFTTFSEKLPPEILVDVLNQYLSMAGSAILMYEGTLDKFIGDAVMGVFNAPLKQEDHVLRAVRAAAAMQRAIADYHRTLDEVRCLQFGVGLHVGEVVVGNVGMSDRMDYTAIGDAVNLAKRIQENTPGGKVLMSKATYQAVKDEVEAVFYQDLRVKGREQPVTLYELRLTS